MIRPFRTVERDELKCARFRSIHKHSKGFIERKLHFTTHTPIIIEDFSVNVNLLIKLLLTRERKIIEENSFWNNVDTAVNKLVNVGV